MEPAGVSQWFPLTDMWHSQRTLRLADGPDEVHHMVVGRAEVRNREAERASGDATIHLGWTGLNQVQIGPLLEFGFL